jgi:hypothetical protein
MPLIAYTPRKFTPSSVTIIDYANEIIGDYIAQGYKLTLRQLYYQFVSRDLLENTVRSYKRLGSIISDGRLAGLIDWYSIEDRTRELKNTSFWHSPAQILEACAKQYKADKWSDQLYRVELWIEKEALAGVFERIAKELGVPYFCCRGYTSQSEMWEAAQRLQYHARNGQTPVILHFGDHDPSGIDMTRDIRDRLALFRCDTLEMDRLALNMDQVNQYQPPPNPAKETDSRFAAYIEKFGNESWELDALEPQVLAELARSRVMEIVDKTKWDAAVLKEENERQVLVDASDRWDEVTEFLENTHD